jgi:hypothetical protein
MWIALPKFRFKAALKIPNEQFAEALFQFSKQQNEGFGANFSSDARRSVSSTGCLIESG